MVRCCLCDLPNLTTFLNNVLMRSDDAGEMCKPFMEMESDPLPFKPS